ncbi:hypothetical protein [Xanthomarina sp. F2636L]|uniref:hypothetical protein n=1 Tax=Xanthomarina sp. F2636L TaxID=2996018 RepID=UPI00225E684A|nr:hypothetical protein [Xanthomarina sp. F2636L]MCX7549638.1 hypothetical protein [Xanthomarina sp. F2636L]
MENIWTILLLIALFSIITFLYWKLTNRYAEKEYGKKMFKQWGTRTFYWTGALFISGGITVCIIYLLKWGNVVTF